MAIATGMIAVADRLAGGTGKDLAAEGLGSADFDQRHDMPLVRRQGCAMLVTIGRAGALEDRVERRHSTASSKRWLVVAAAASACGVRCV